MRAASTYRAARRNGVKIANGSMGRFWRPRTAWNGIVCRAYPRKPANAAKLKKPQPVGIIVPPLVQALMKQGVFA